MDDLDLKTKVKDQILTTKDLPTLPKVLDEVTRLLENPNTSTDDIAKVISTDQVLSAKVLKMVNSPVYGFPGRIGSLGHALMLLGLNVLRGIIISTSVFDIMAKAMQGLWEHSLGCATISGIIAKARGFDNPEEFTVAGLLHDLGKVVTAVQMPELHKNVVEAVKAKDLRWFEAEKEVMGFGHDRINAWLARHWNLPANVREAMTYHHAPELSQLYPQITAVVHVADFVVRVFEFGSGGDDQAVPLKESALKTLGMDLAALERVMDEFAAQTVEIADLDFA